MWMISTVKYQWGRGVYRKSEGTGRGRKQNQESIFTETKGRECEGEHDWQDQIVWRGQARWRRMKSVRVSKEK